MWSRYGQTPWRNPALVGILALFTLLSLTSTACEDYFGNVRIIHFLLDQRQRPGHPPCRDPSLFCVVFRQ
ncbi:hypothetical protein [Acetobacter sp. AN02]|uniref:hypothetical protein n=1 Tax=Acetobacter sp. AN02 TaxID=2894186 RepID=UPI0038D011EF